MTRLLVAGMTGLLIAGTGYQVLEGSWLALGGAVLSAVGVWLVGALADGGWA
jgi:hypothetical protein